MTLREFPEENRCELVTPQCQCGRYMVQDDVALYLGSNNTTRKRGGKTYLDPMTFGVTGTMFKLRFRCPKHNTFVKIPMEEIVKMNQYPPSNIKFVDRNWCELR